MKAASDQPGCWHLKSCWGVLLQHSHSRSSLCTLLCPLPPTLQHPEICYCFAHRKKTQRMTLAQRRFQSLSFRNMTNTLGHVLGTCRPTPPELGQHRAPTDVPSTSHTPCVLHSLHGRPCPKHLRVQKAPEQSELAWALGLTRVQPQIPALLLHHELRLQMN